MAATAAPTRGRLSPRLAGALHQIGHRFRPRRARLGNHTAAFVVMGDDLAAALGQAATVLDGIPDGGLVVIDGLALGGMPALIAA